MTRLLLERRLSGVTYRLQAARDELVVADEQLAALATTAEETRLRALVSETPMAAGEHLQAQRHADAMARHRADLAARLAQLEVDQDRLLERLVAEPS